MNLVPHGSAESSETKGKSGFDGKYSLVESWPEVACNTTHTVRYKIVLPRISYFSTFQVSYVSTTFAIPYSLTK